MESKNIDSIIPGKTQAEINAEEWKNPGNWTGPSWLSVYFSKKDARTWVPKQIPWMGYTLNLGKSAGVAWMFGIFFGIIIWLSLVIAMQALLSAWK